MSVGGYRVTESSDQRILEDGSLRVTENLFSVESSISASSSFDFVPALKATGATSLNGSGIVAADGAVTRYAAILIANNSSMTAVPLRTTVGEFAGNASSDIIADVDAMFTGATALSASGSMIPAARTVKYVFFISGVSTFDRITENDDYRVTEDGNNRITNEIAVNVVDSTLVAEATQIPFSSVAYYKQNGVWKVADVDAKNSGNWDALQAVYKKISGSWKRIY